MLSASVHPVIWFDFKCKKGRKGELAAKGMVRGRTMDTGFSKNAHPPTAI